MSGTLDFTGVRGFVHPICSGGACAIPGMPGR